MGSSPHTWRILLDVILGGIDHRIISTYVENTKSRITTTDIDTGSSPHTWRIPNMATRLYGPGGIISTYVENT